MTILLAFLVTLAIICVMAVGVIFGRKPITGSCGGMKALGMEMECEVCGGDPGRCEDLAVNAVRPRTTSRRTPGS
ncbi:MAG: (Na+)-NQR maturation NqrM [Pseudomonadales bacterium]